MVQKFEAVCVGGFTMSMRNLMPRPCPTLQAKLRVGVGSNEPRGLSEAIQVNGTHLGLQ